MSEAVGVFVWAGAEYAIFESDIPEAVGYIVYRFAGERIKRYVYSCSACEEMVVECFTLADVRLCDRCAEFFANHYNKAHSGMWLTWKNERQPSAKRRDIPHKLRRAIFERDHYRCRYCGDFKGGLTLDHVMPVSRGGTDDLENLVTACKSCNSRKKTKTLDEWGVPLLEVPA